MRLLCVHSFVSHSSPPVHNIDRRFSSIVALHHAASENWPLANCGVPGFDYTTSSSQGRGTFGIMIYTFTILDRTNRSTFRDRFFRGTDVFQRRENALMNIMAAREQLLPGLTAGFSRSVRPLLPTTGPFFYAPCGCSPRPL